MNQYANSFAEFLLDRNKLYLKEEYRNEYDREERNQFYKEPYNERFYFLYEKDNRNIKDQDYKFLGFYDTIEKIIYEANWHLENRIKKEKLDIECKITYASVLNKIYKEILESLEKYMIEKETELKPKGKEEYLKHFDYNDSARKKIAISNVITDGRYGELESKPSIKDIGDHIPIWRSYEVIPEYLLFPKETVNKLVSNIVSIRKYVELMGYTILCNQEQQRIYQEVLENHDSEYEQVHINKRIYNKIIDVSAVTFNITIQYNSESLTFKFDKDILIRELKEGDIGASSYGKSYEEVEQFIKKHDPDDWHRQFKFSNITSITFKGKELYSRIETDSFKKKEESELKEPEEDIELEKD